MLGWLDKALAFSFGLALALSLSFRRAVDITSPSHRDPMPKRAVGSACRELHLVIIDDSALNSPIRTRPHDGIRVLEATGVHVELVILWVDSLCMAPSKQVGLLPLQAAMILNFHMDKVEGARIALTPSFWGRRVYLEHTHAPSSSATKTQQAVTWGHANLEPLFVGLVVFEPYGDGCPAQKKKRLWRAVSIFATAATSVVIVGGATQRAFDDTTTKVLVADRNIFRLEPQLLWKSPPMNSITFAAL